MLVGRSVDSITFDRGLVDLRKKNTKNKRHHSFNDNKLHKDNLGSKCKLILPQRQWSGLTWMPCLPAWPKRKEKHKLNSFVYEWNLIIHHFRQSVGNGIVDRRNVKELLRRQRQRIITIFPQSSSSKEESDCGLVVWTFLFTTYSNK